MDRQIYKSLHPRTKLTLSNMAAILAISVFWAALISLISQFYRTSSDQLSPPLSPDHQVLFISSYHETFDTIPDQKQGLEEVFYTHNIAYDTEFMDVRQYNGQENVDNFYRTLSYKLAHHAPYDVIVLGDDAALEFGLDHRQELFGQIPMVFLGINNKETAIRAMQDPMITGIVEEFYLKDTIDAALRLTSNARTLTAIYDDTNTGQGDAKQFMALQSTYPDYTINGINFSEYTLDEFSRRLSALEDDTILVYMSAFEDSLGNTYSIREMASFISQNAPIPAYRTTIGGMGLGILGGKLFSHEDMARLAASAVVSIIKGTAPRDITISSEPAATYLFDYSVLKQYNMNPDLLPADTEFLNRYPAFWVQYRNILLPGIAIFLSLLLMMSLLYRNYFHLRQFTTELQITYGRLQDTEQALAKEYATNQTYVSTLEQQKKSLMFITDHDLLTQLPNRRTAINLLNELLDKGEKCSLLLMDIDGFKAINDSYGHICGDFILKTLAARLRSLTEDGSLYVARFGGDEFLLIYRNILLSHEGEGLNQLTETINKPIIMNGILHNVTASMGVSLSCDCSGIANTLITNANLAVREARARGKNTILFFDPAMEAARQSSQKINEILQDALHNDGIKVLYQPQIDTATGKLIGFEALARLKDSSLSPKYFIPAAEENGMILPIGRRVAELVVAQLAQWRAQGLPLYPVAINYSFRQIHDVQYVTFLKKLLEKYDIAPQYIEIEITESLLIHNAQESNSLFEAFSSTGISLALDDFGTGYSSLSYLTYIPVSKIKLDKSLVDSYLHQGRDTFIRNIIRLAHDLGLTITVEGVEHLWQYEQLKAFQCNYVQGYYFSPPIESSTAEKWLQDSME